jgi:hypothetical protein
MARSATLAIPAWQGVRLALSSTRVVATLLFGVAAALRLALATRMTFPPAGDAAYYIAVARNLYAGRGFTVGTVLAYQPPPPAVVGPSNAYWGPLTSFAEWLSFLFWGDHLFAALLPGIVAGSALVALTYVWGRCVLREWLLARGTATREAERAAAWLAVGASLLVGVNAQLTYQSVMGASGMLYGAIAFPAIVLWERALRLPRPDDAGRWWRRTWGWPGATTAAWSAGGLLGLAYLTRAAALFLGAACATWWLWLLIQRGERTVPSQRRRLVGAGAALVVGALVVVTPWLIRQQLVFGYVLSPEAHNNALAFTLEEFANYGAAPTLAAYARHGAGALLGLRGAALWDAIHHVLDFLLYPTALPAVAGLWLLARCQATARCGLIHAAWLMFGFVAIFPAVALYGGFYQSVASVAPFLAWGYLAAVYAVAGWLRRQLSLRAALAPALAAIPLLVQVGLVGLTFPLVATTASQSRDAVDGASRWLRSHHARVVMASEAASFHFGSGLPTVQLPGAQGPDVVYACARRYGAQYLVITDVFGRYPQILREQPSPHFVLVARTPSYEVYQIVT